PLPARCNTGQPSPRPKPVKSSESCTPSQSYRDKNTCSVPAIAMPYQSNIPRLDNPSKLCVFIYLYGSSRFKTSTGQLPTIASGKLLHILVLSPTNGLPPQIARARP